MPAFQVHESLIQGLKVCKTSCLHPCHLQYIWSLSSLVSWSTPSLWQASYSSSISKIPCVSMPTWASSSQLHTEPAQQFHVGNSAIIHIVLALYFLRISWYIYVPMILRFSKIKSVWTPDASFWYQPETQPVTLDPWLHELLITGWMNWKNSFPDSPVWDHICMVFSRTLF